MKNLIELQEECEGQLLDLLKSDPTTDKNPKVQSFLESLEDVIQERIDLAFSDHSTVHEY